MVDKQRYQAHIAGKNYTIVGNRSSQHMNLVTQLVNQQMAHLHQLDPNLSLTDQCILMAINAISDQINKEAKIIALEKEVAELKHAKASSSSHEGHVSLNPQRSQLRGERDQIPFKRNQ